MNIGLTGGIATGKSSVSAYLASKGALLIDADVIAREVMMPGHPVLAAAVKRFGQAILNEDGTLKEVEVTPGRKYKGKDLLYNIGMAWNRSPESRGSAPGLQELRSGLLLSPATPSFSFHNFPSFHRSHPKKGGFPRFPAVSSPVFPSGF